MFRICLILICLPILSFAQDLNSWHHLDPEKDKVLGVSTKRAYKLLKGKTPDTVVVAILDNGAEITHPDIQANIWVNKNEIPDNNIDDDGNGYIDDIHGWNFLGNAEGENYRRETIGLTRVYAKLRDKYASVNENDLDEDEKESYKYYLKVKEEFENEVATKREDINYHKEILQLFNDTDQFLKIFLKKEDYTKKDVEKIKKKKPEVQRAKQNRLLFYQRKTDAASLQKSIDNLKKDMTSRLNPDFKNREEVVGDDPDDITDTNYGNNMVWARGPYHGTGVASIIGGIHNENTVDGMVQPVKLMILRVVPNGDERDKDVALAIRYAINNGADIINLSFAKKYSVNPSFVEEAIKDAIEKDVLIVQAAGNWVYNNDTVPHYPTGMIDDKKAENYIVVGASDKIDNENVLAYFANYGKESVDIFAPGMDIPACELKGTYGKGSGSSDAAPIVAGAAALIKAYYPDLSAAQIKKVIMQSAYRPQTKKVKVPGNDKMLVTMDELCVSGGIMNLFRAIELIEKEYK